MLLSKVTYIAFTVHLFNSCIHWELYDLDIAAAARRVISASEEQPFCFSVQ